MCAPDICQRCEARRPVFKIVAYRLRDNGLLDAILLCAECARAPSTATLQRLVTDAEALERA